ncbi:MAG: NUDIX hydrolase [Desulfuromonadales bacterium]
MTHKIIPLLPDSPPKILCSSLKPILLEHQNPWFKVMSRGSYFSIEYDRPQVVILPVLNGDSIIMVRVKRPLIDDSPLELPAGDSDDGETPRLAAMREFAEETGVVINDPLRFVPILPISEMPGRMPVLLSIFRVDISQNEFDSRIYHDAEIVSVETLSFSQAARMIIAGEIYLSSPMAVLSRLLLEKTEQSGNGKKE